MTLSTAVVLLMSLWLILSTDFHASRLAGTGTGQGICGDVSRRVFESQEQSFRVVCVAEGLERPWSLAPLPNGDFLVTERAGRLRVIRDGSLLAEPVGTVPDVAAEDHGGLLDVVPDVNFGSTRRLYLSYSKRGPRGVTVAWASARLAERTLEEIREIFVADAWHSGFENFGGRIAVAANGDVYMTVGDRMERDRAQQLTDHAGTIVRLRGDGSVPADNPFVRRRHARPEIFSYGHRNAQGLAFDGTGTLWAHEHGPQGGDELNLVRAGLNYGWPAVTYGREYTGGIIAERPWRKGMEQPLMFWAPSIGPSGMTFYTGRYFPAWQTGLFLGALAAEHVERIVFSDKGPVHREPLLGSLRLRIRDVRQGADELLYVLTDGQSGAVLRIEPADDGPVPPEADTPVS